MWTVPKTLPFEALSFFYWRLQVMVRAKCGDFVEGQAKSGLQPQMPGGVVDWSLLWPVTVSWEAAPVSICP